MAEDNVVREEQKYLISVLRVLMEKKELAIREFLNTDLNTSEQLSEINIWYDTVVQMVKKEPPTFPPLRLKMYEDKNGRIMRIEYDYDLTFKGKFTPSIIILNEM